MSDMVEDRLVAEVARDQVEQIAPQEAPIFPLLSEAYFQDPDKMLEAQGKDEMLGFGLEVGAVLLTPVVMTVTREVVEFLAGVVMTSVQTQSSGLINEFVKKMFKKFRREEEAKGEKLLPPPLTREQIVRVREIALEKARQLQLPSNQAGLLADSLVGSLATTPGGEIHDR
jgi:hypothetical protein